MIYSLPGSPGRYSILLWLVYHTDLETLFQQNSDGIPQELLRQNSSRAIPTKFLRSLLMESSINVFLEELLWSSYRGSNEEYSSTAVLKELCTGNGLHGDVLRNSPVIPQVVHSL